MNRFSAAILLNLALLSKESLAAYPDNECCLCNDCDMMMKPDSQVYDIDEDKLISCSDFADFVYFNVDGNHNTCRGVQEMYQRSCCLNTLQLTDAVDADHRSLNEKDQDVTIPFSRRELQTWTAKSNFIPSFGATQSFGGFPVKPAAVSAPSTSALRSFPEPSPITTQPQNTNGNALGCVVPIEKSATMVQVYTPTEYGFSTPKNVRCADASHNGIGAGLGAMYNVSLKCVRCSCCSGQCTGTDARVCYGNNQPRAAASYSGWTAN